MSKRFFCMICAVVILIGALCGVRSSAVPMRSTDKVPVVNLLSKAKNTHRPNPLVSAMLLILAGVGVSMLFDKKDRE